jgi:large subunit ribosomal protein L5
MAARLRKHYTEKVVPALTKEFGYTNPMAVPKIEKISINIGLGEATQNAKIMDGAVAELAAIAGQKPVVTKATKSIAQTKSFDGRGNYTLGIKDQLIFPEIDYAKVEKTKGMNISITTTARTDAEGLALLKQMGMPFRQ